MPIVALASLHGSPGVTTLSLALTASMTRGSIPAYYLEADPGGGVVAARFDRPLIPNLTGLAGAARHDLAIEQVNEHVQHLMDGVRGVVAHPCSTQSSSALRVGAEVLARVCAADSSTAVVDLGRWHPEHPGAALALSARSLVLLVRPVLEHVALTVNATKNIVNRHKLSLVTVGSRVYSDRQIGEATGLAVLGHLPEPDLSLLGDPVAALRRRRSPWSSAVTAICASLAVDSAGAP